MILYTLVMARPLRIEYEHALYHVMSRGHRKENIFFTARDREVFVKKLHESLTKYSVILYCFCLMDNHYHLLIETPSPNLSAFMHYLNASYSNFINAKYKLTGSLFQGRFKSILVEDDSYLLSLSTYIHLNPLRAKLVDDLAFYPWSSYHDYINKEKIHPFVDTTLIHNRIYPQSYVSFIRDCYHSRVSIDKSMIYGENGVIGSDQFRDNIIKKAEENLKKDKIQFNEYPVISSSHKLTFDSVYRIFQKIVPFDKNILAQKYCRNPIKKLFIYVLKHYSELKNIEIAEKLNIHYTRVSVNDRNFEALCQTDLNFQKLAEKVVKAVKAYGEKELD
jgi:REP element-mobilizing transposase RayT